MKIISASIDVTNIDKTKLVDGKNGAKYLNIDIIVNDDKDKFGNDTGITLKQTKEERDSKAKKVYIGNGKTVWEKKSEQAPANKPVQNNAAYDDSSDSLPF